jgi:hypothetical protein
VVQGGRWAQLPTSADSGRGAGNPAAHARTSRPSLEVPCNSDAASGQNLSHQQSGITSSSNLRSPGGVSLHARTPGPLRQPLAARLGASSVSSSFRTEAEDGSTAGSSTDLAAPGPHHRLRSALRNQVVPLDAGMLAGGQAGPATTPVQHSLDDRAQVPSQLAPQQPGASTAAAAGEEVPHAGQQQDVEEGDSAAGQGRLPTLSGRVPVRHLQAMGPGSPKGH